MFDHFYLGFLYPGKSMLFLLRNISLAAEILKTENSRALASNLQTEALASSVPFLLIIVIIATLLKY